MLDIARRGQSIILSNSGSGLGINIARAARVLKSTHSHKPAENWMSRKHLKKLAFPVIACLLSAAGAYGQPKPKKRDLVLAKCWAYSLPDAAGLRMTSDGSRVFVGLEGGRVMALATDGTKLWSADLGGEISSRIVTSSGAVFVVTTGVKEDGSAAGESSLHSLSGQTGVTNWAVKLPGSIVYFLRPAAGGVIAVSSTGMVHNVDGATGTIIWRTPLDGPVEIEPTSVLNDLLVVSGAKLRRVGMGTGRASAVNGIAGDVTALGVLGDGSFAFGDGRGIVSALTGTAIRWKFRSGGAVSSILPMERRVLFASHDNFVYYISSKKGYVEWRRRLPGRVVSVAGFADRWAIAETQEEQSPLVVLDLENGKTAAQVPIGPGETVADRPFVNDGLLIVLTDGSVQAYSSGECTAKKKGGSPIGAKPPSQKKL